MKNLVLVIYLMLLVFASNACADQYQYFGLDKFTLQEQQNITHWLKFTQSATEKTIGKYPFSVELHIAPRNADEPVPWANTKRGQTQSIYFYVDTRFSQQTFIDDWTSYHELSHLALPYLGSKNRWFAEGFASFMQYQIMSKAGVLKNSIAQSYQYKLAPHLDKYQTDVTAMETIETLFRNRQYKAGYWASAWFFILADKRLQEQNSSMVRIVSRYLICCRMQDDTLEDVLSSWDDLVGTPLFSTLKKDFDNNKSRSIFP